MTIETLITKLESLKPKACSDAVDYVRSCKTVEECFSQCDRGDWFVWLIGKTMNLHSENHLRKFVLVKGLYANQLVHLMKDERSRKAVEVAIAYGNGTASRKDLDEAGNDAYDAYIDADDGSSDSSDSSFYAAYAADCASLAYAINVGDVDFVISIQKDLLKKCADIVREHYSLEDLLELIGE
jgi:hypothetical protein